MPPHEPLSYDEIHSIQKRERSTRNITKVSHDFYARLAAYLADAKAGLDEESGKGASPRLMMLQGQMRNLEEMAREILLMRLHKVTELSFAAVESGALADKPLTPEELAFAKDVQVLVEGTRMKLMPGPGRAPAPVRSAPAPVLSPAPPPPPSPVPAVAKAPVAPPPVADDVVLLRILDDVPPFEGEDNRVYKLKREDVVSLPRTFAQILVRRKKAVEMPLPP